MQDRPDKAALLDAVARFLAGDLRPTVDDEALSFRVLIAAHLCMVVAEEIRTEDGQDAAELGHLAELLPGLDDDATPPATRSERQERFAELRRALADHVRDLEDVVPRGPLWEHLRETLREKLRVNNPRFDLSERLPAERE
jgi:AcrR family transcriptional regulator